MKTENQDSQEESIQDTIRAAMDTSTPEVEVNSDVVEETQVSDRDENGRFKAKTPAKVEDVADPAVEQEVATVDKPAWDPSRPPSSWKPKVREKWASLDPEVREEITRREENAAMGIQKLKAERAPVDRFIEDLAPHMQDIARSGANPNQHLFELLETERGLRSGDMPMKFNALLAMADKYAIPLRDIINASVGQEILSKPQQQQQASAHIPPEIRRELDEIRGWREQQEQGMVDMQVHAFGSDKEFFNDVRELMADFIETGRAKSLEDAYDMAVWANPEIRDIMVSRRAATPVTQRQAKAVGIGVRPSGAVNVALDDDDSGDSIADTVRKSMMRAESGRI